MEHQLTRGGRGVDGPVAEGTEAHATFLELLDQVDQVRHRAAEAIEAPDQEHVPLFQGLQAGLQPRPLGPRPGDFIHEDPIPAAPALLQGVDLEIQVLVVLADAGVPDEAPPREFGGLHLTASCPTLTHHSWVDGTLIPEMGK